MKKVRFVLMASAIVLAIGGAVASSSQAPCSNAKQFYRGSDGNYYPAGIENVDYVCKWDHFTTCTYYFDEATQQYRPCKYGKLLWLR